MKMIVYAVRMNSQCIQNDLNLNAYTHVYIYSILKNKKKKKEE